MYGQSSKRRRIKPYARPTSFDFNLRYDIRQYQDVKYNNVIRPYFTSAGNDEVFRVMEGELLMSKRQTSHYNDKELHVFSFCNGLELPPALANNDVAMQAVGNDGRLNESAGALANANPDIRARCRAGILSTLQYSGVAVTEFSPARDVYEQGFVSTIAGLNTLYNNGKYTIHPGEVLCVDLPETREDKNSRYRRAVQAGVPGEKLQFVLTPLSKMSAPAGSAYTPEVAAALGALGVRFNIRDYIIGTSISYARPGDNVDVILHRINYEVNRQARDVNIGEDEDGGNNIEEDLGGGGRGAIPINKKDSANAKKKKVKKAK